MSLAASAPGGAPQTDADGGYEELFGLWLDLEASLSMVLAHPQRVREFPAKIAQLDRWLRSLVQQDTDAALYLMFQLAGTSTVGYSASHALVCATLAHIAAAELGLPAAERDALVPAAMTMNVAMTALQDQLALQYERPSAAQRDAIRRHAIEGQEMLRLLGIANPLWLDAVGNHHADAAGLAAAQRPAPALRLVRLLGAIDRYAAVISPRKSRPGRSAADGMRAIMGGNAPRDEIGYALVRAVGLCPPGTFVLLDNGQTALVLRRGAVPNLPIVASLLDRRGEPLPQPRLHATAEGTPRIRAALARPALRTEPDHRTMLRLGRYAALHADGIEPPDTGLCQI
ncbi:HD-GYP domain-containing protein [Xylophilus sp.]|uniref:HD-GYP domain-containing protein n=1 Tax=Xylophilus sp. TaxID=2653893 RepID=UPI0013B8BE18|nr:phosphodiesterase [Xylophilus sp.]KAF1049482.1 MAG: Cyclic di-GMP phosphodiesterase [Xylophilus sp.]